MKFNSSHYLSQGQDNTVAISQRQHDIVIDHNGIRGNNPCNLGIFVGSSRMRLKQTSKMQDPRSLE